MSFIISRSCPRINLILGYNPKIFASATPAPSIGIREVLCESHSFFRYLIHSHQIHRKKKKKLKPYSPHQATSPLPLARQPPNSAAITD